MDTKNIIMKKLLILSAITIFSLSSFSSFDASENAKEEVRTRYTVYFHCTDGHMNGSFQTYSSDPAVWQSIANSLCNL